MQTFIINILSFFPPLLNLGRNIGWLRWYGLSIITADSCNGSWPNCAVQIMMKKNFYSYLLSSPSDSRFGLSPEPNERKHVSGAQLQLGEEVFISSLTGTGEIGSTFHFGSLYISILTTERDRNPVPEIFLRKFPHILLLQSSQRYFEFC